MGCGSVEDLYMYRLIKGTATGTRYKVQIGKATWAVM